MTKLPLSVSLISLNEEERIIYTLESVKDIANEIILIDSCSIDATKNIAEKYGAQIYEEKWRGFAGQKNFSLSKCTEKWILCLDCDEELTPELIKEIKSIIENPKSDGYYIQRKTMYLGKLLDRSWQPDRRLRLVKRSCNPRWVGEFVHEELLIDGVSGNAINFMVHRSYKDIKDHMMKTIRYASLSADSYFANGKKASYIKLFCSPFFAFVKLYIIKLGFLDGVRGLIAATSGYIYSFLKYAFLWDKYRRKDRS